MIVEADEPDETLTPTAAFRFQVDGAEVLATRYQYAITLGDEGTTMDEALDDLKALAPAPRTLEAAQRLLQPE